MRVHELISSSLLNVTIRRRDIVIANDSLFCNIGTWYNDSGKSITAIDFFDKSNQGALRRIESLRPGIFWHVWIKFFPHTDSNRANVNAT